MLAEMIDFIQEHKKEEDFEAVALEKIKQQLPDDERSEQFASDILELILEEEKEIADNITINFLSHRIYQEGIPVDLTSNEIKIIEMLARNKGNLVPYNHLIEKLWGYAEDNSILKVNISHIRNKTKIPITSIKGLGYKLGNG